MIRVAICLAGALLGAPALQDQAKEREVWACLAETLDVTDSNVEIGKTSSSCGPASSW